MNKIDSAENLMRKGFHSLAKSMLLELVIEEPDNLRAICNLGIAYTETGENEKAIRALKHYLTNDAENAYAWEAFACAQLRIGNLEDAHENLKRSLKIIPENHSALRNLGILLGLKGRYEVSSRVLKRALAISPEDYRILYALSFTLKDAGCTHERTKVLEDIQRLPEESVPDKIRLHADATLIQLSIGWEA